MPQAFWCTYWGAQTAFWTFLPWALFLSLTSSVWVSWATLSLKSGWRSPVELLAFPGRYGTSSSGVCSCAHLLLFSVPCWEESISTQNPSHCISHNNGLCSHSWGIWSPILLYEVWDFLALSHCLSVCFLTSRKGVILILNVKLFQ